jgi:hypothetical protein
MTWVPWELELELVLKQLRYSKREREGKSCCVMQEKPRKFIVLFVCLYLYYKLCNNSIYFMCSLISCRYTSPEHGHA